MPLRHKKYKLICMICSKDFYVVKKLLVKRKTCSADCGKLLRKQNLQTPLERFWKHVNIPFDATINECWEWVAGKTNDGYGTLALTNGNKSRAHKFSFRLFKGEPENLVCHTCNNRACVNPNHLYDGTQKQNMEDRHRKTIKC